MRSRIIALILIAILSGSAIVYSVINPRTPGTTEPEPPIPIISLNSTVHILDTTTYKGDMINMELSVEVNTTTTLSAIRINATDPKYNRQGSQMIPLNLTLDAGQLTTQLKISPAFPDGFGMVMAEPDLAYQIDSYTLFYNNSKNYIKTGMINSQLSIMKNTAYDQMDHLDWTVPDQTASVVASAGTLNITSAIPTTFTLSTLINTTGYTRLNYSLSIADANLVMLVDNYTLGPIPENYLPLGNFKGMHNLTLTGTINTGGSLNMSLSLITKRVVFFTVIADNHWAGTGTDGYVFRDPSYYIQQASSPFENVFNVTYIPSKVVHTSTPDSDNLVDYTNTVLTEVGTALNLTSDIWTIGSGTFEQNMGYDLLLVFTNVTMQHLGIVYGNQTGAFNLGVHSRGSHYTGNYRLPPVFADNLIQHEVSHIFGAPDRFTTTSPPSIMTKSTPDAALGDILRGTFWLYQTSWLEQDIQTMTVVLQSFYW